MYDKQHEERRKQFETKETIIRIAVLKGYFEASLRYRDKWLRERCAQLVGEGLLKKDGHDHGNIVYSPTELAIQLQRKREIDKLC